MREATQRHPRIESLETRIAPATFTWDGGGTNPLWSTPENWLGDIAPTPDAATDIVFPSDAAQKSSIYDFPDTAAFGTITFAGSGFVIDPADASHDTIALHGGFKSTDSVIGQNCVVNLNLLLAADVEFNATAYQTLRFNGSIAGNGHAISFTGQYTVEIAGALTDIPVLNSTGPTVLWKSAQTFSGEVNLYRGDLYIQGSANPAFTGALQIGDGSYSVPIARMFIHSSTDLGVVAVSLNSGELDLGNHDVALASLTAENSSLVDIGRGHLSLEGDLRIDRSFFAINYDLIAGTAAVTVQGDVSLDYTIILSWYSLTSAPAGTRVRLVEHSSPGPITGRFESFTENNMLSLSGVAYQFTCHGGDGNDLDIIIGRPTVSIAADGKTATYRDVDGDLVKITTTAGTFTPASFHTAWGTKAAKGMQVQELTLDASFDGAAIKFSATPTKLGGNGKVNIGRIAASTSLDSVILPGDLGQFDQGSGTTTTMNLLRVSSLGAKGPSTQDPDTASLDSHIDGRLARLSVLNSMRGIAFRTDGRIDAIRIGGNMIDATISASQLPDIIVYGSIKATESGDGAGIGANRIGSISVGGSIVGTAEHPVAITAIQDVSSGVNTDLVIRSLSVRGNVSRAVITAGVNSPGIGGNPDASIGYVYVGGNWIASSMAAGVNAGTDGFFGTSDDKKAPPTVTDRGLLSSQIKSLIIQGVVKGTAGDTSDSFGIVAEDIQRVQIHGVNIPLHAGLGTIADAQALASTGPGATGSKSDVLLRECRK